MTQAILGRDRQHGALEQLEIDVTLDRYGRLFPEPDEWRTPRSGHGSNQNSHRGNPSET